MSRERGLLALSVVAALFVALVILLPGRQAPVLTSRRVLPHLERAQITFLHLEPAQGQPVMLQRLEQTDELVLANGVAQEAAVDELVGVLELLSYQRRLPRARAGDPPLGLQAPTATVEIGRRDAEPVLLRVGAVRSGRAWLEVGGAEFVYLIDEYAARVLTRGLEELRARSLIRARPSEITAIEAFAGDASVVLATTGQPRITVAGGQLRADPVHVADFIERLRELSIASFTAETAPAEGTERLWLRVIGAGEPQEVIVGGRCGDAVLAIAPVGAGCVDAQAVAAVEAEILAPRQFIDRALVRGRPSRIEVRSAAGNFELKRAGARWQLDGAPAATDAVEAWLETLRTALVPEPVSWPGGAAQAELVVFSGDEQERIQIARDAEGRRYARRPGDSLALPLADGIIATPPASALRDRSLVREEPYALRELEVRHRDRVVARLARGALVDDWRDLSGSRETSLGASAAQRMAELRSVLATLRVVAFPDLERFSPDRRLDVVFDPPPLGAAASERRYRIELDRACRVRVNQGPVGQLAPEPCSILRDAGRR